MQDTLMIYNFTETAVQKYVQRHIDSNFKLKSARPKPRTKTQTPSRQTTLNQQTPCLSQAESAFLQIHYVKDR